MASTLAVLVVTPRPLVEYGLRITLKTSGHLQFFETVPDGSTSHQGSPGPHLLVFDAGSQPWMHLKDLVQLKRRWSFAHTLIMVSEYNRQTQAFLSKAGATDWCLDNISGADLVQRLLRLARRPKRAAPVYEDPTESRTYSSVNTLTAREIEVLDMLAQGLTNKDIANQLGLTEFTVKSYLKVIYNKLQVSNRVEATLVLHNQYAHLNPFSHLSHTAVPRSATTM